MKRNQQPRKRVFLGIAIGTLAAAGLLYLAGSFSRADRPRGMISPAPQRQANSSSTVCIEKAAPSSDRQSVSSDQFGGAPSGGSLSRSGTLRLHVLQLDGTSAPDGTNVAIRSFAASGDEWELRKLVNGYAIFNVDRGQMLDVRVFDEARTNESRITTSFPSGGLADITQVVIFPSDTKLCFTLIDTQGEVLSNASVKVTMKRRHCGFTQARSTLAQADALGHVCCAIDIIPTMVGTNVLLIEDVPGARFWVGSMTSSDLAAPANLGPVTLAPWPFRISGAVADAHNNPVPGATVFMETLADDDAIGGGYEESRSMEVVADADGRFSIPYLGMDALLQAHFSSGSLRSRRVIVNAASGDVVLTLEGAGAFSGALIVDEEIDESLLRFHVESSEGAVQPCHVLSASAVPGGKRLSFVCSDLLPGSWTFFLSSNSEPIAAVENLIVIGTDETRDARLDPIDLRGILHARVIRLRSPQPSGTLAGRIRYGPTGCEYSMSFAGDRIVILSRLGDTISADVRVSGFRGERLTLLEKHTDLLLRAGIPVVLRLPHEFELPAPPLFLVVGLEEDREWPHVSFSEFDGGSREVRTVVGGVGVMKVVWGIKMESNGIGAQRSLDAMPHSIVTVTESVVEQAVILTVSNADLMRAMEDK